MNNDSLSINYSASSWSESKAELQIITQVSLSENASQSNQNQLIYFNQQKAQMKSSTNNEGIFYTKNCWQKEHKSYKLFNNKKKGLAFQQPAIYVFSKIASATKTDKPKGLKLIYLDVVIPTLTIQ